MGEKTTYLELEIPTWLDEKLRDVDVVQILIDYVGEE